MTEANRPIVNPSYFIPAGEYAQNIRKSILDLIFSVLTPEISEILRNLTENSHCMDQPLSVPEETVVELISLFESGRLKNETTGTLTERVNENMERKDLLIKHKERYTYTAHKKGNGKIEYKTKLGDKYVTAASEKLLDDKVYVYYKKSQKHYLNDIFEEHRKYRIEVDNIASGTVKILNRTHRNFWCKTNFSTIALEDFTEDDAEEFLNQCKAIKPDMTKNYWKNQILGPVNALFKYLRIQKIRKTNPFDNLVIPNSYFRKENPHKKESRVFLDSEASSVISMTHSDLVNRKDTRAGAIELLFYIGDRIGEHCPQKWKDIENDYSKIHIQREIITNSDEEGVQHGYEVVDHTKTPAGDRRIPLNENAKIIYKMIKEINQERGFGTGPDDYIFVRKYKGEITCFSERSIFNKLQNYCDDAEMPERKSPHDIRRTVITNLHRSGMPIEKLKEYAGHESIQQTMDYINNVEGSDDDEKYFEALNHRNDSHSVSKDSENTGNKPLFTLVHDGTRQNNENEKTGNP